MAFENQTIGLIGVGALGGFYGGLMAKASLNVHFLAKSDAEFIANFGLRIDSKWGDFFINNIHVYADSESMPKCDVIFICLKTTQNHQLKKILSNITKPSSILCTLQNGLGIEQSLTEMYPQLIVTGGLCFLCSNKVGPGHIHHLDYGQIRLGLHKNPVQDMTSNQEVLKKMGTLFELSSIPYQIVDNLNHARWQKLVWNIPFNGFSVILRKNTQEMLEQPFIEHLIENIMEEVKFCAEQDGCEISSNFLAKMIQDTKKMTPYKTSMLLDFEKKMPMEVDAIYSYPIQQAHLKTILQKKIPVRNPNTFLIDTYKHFTQNRGLAFNLGTILDEYPLTPNLALIRSMLLSYNSELRGD